MFHAKQNVLKYCVLKYLWLKESDIDSELNKYHASSIRNYDLLFAFDTNMSVKSYNLNELVSKFNGIKIWLHNTMILWDEKTNKFNHCDE